MHYLLIVLLLALLVLIFLCYRIYQYHKHKIEGFDFYNHEAYLGIAISERFGLYQFYVLAIDPEKETFSMEYRGAKIMTLWDLRNKCPKMQVVLQARSFKDIQKATILYSSHTPTVFSE